MNAKTIVKQLTENEDESKMKHSRIISASPKEDALAQLNQDIMKIIEAYFTKYTDEDAEIRDVLGDTYVYIREYLNKE